MSALRIIEAASAIGWISAVVFGVLAIVSPDLADRVFCGIVCALFIALSGFLTLR